MATAQTGELIYEMQFTSPEVGERVRSATDSLVATVLARARLPKDIRWQKINLTRGSVEELDIRGDGEGNVARMNHLFTSSWPHILFMTAYDKGQEGQVSLIESVVQQGEVLGDYVAMGDEIADTIVYRIGTCAGLAAEIVLAVPAAE